MVGLPYPNIYSPELKEKMTYLDATLGVRIYTCRFKPSGVPWAGRMAEGFLCKENDVPCKETTPPSSIKVKCPRYIFSHIFCGLLLYTALYRIVRHTSKKPFPSLVLRSFNSGQNLFLPVAPTFPDFPVFISIFPLRFFEVFELTFVPVGLRANFLL